MNALFVGLGKSAICWYRCVLPAQAMGADWVSFLGEPPQILYEAGMVDGGATVPRFESYDVVVIQQARGSGWTKMIGELQAKGVKVLYEIDDYVHAIRKMPDHDWQDSFQPKHLKAMELNMRVCDGLICATEFLAAKYRRFNRNTYVCRNGIDLGRYRLTRPERPTVNLIWAGATAHGRSFSRWLPMIARVMNERPNVCFISIGQAFADVLAEHFGNRAIAIPFTMLETYPSAMTMGDIALAPAGDNLFFRGKSDLRMLEAGALGIPLIGDPRVYVNIEDGVNGLHAQTADEAYAAMIRLVDDAEERERLGRAAYEYVRDERTLRSTGMDWLNAFADVAG